MEVDIYEDLTLSVLAVNNWAVSKVYNIRHALRAEDLFAPDVVKETNHNVLIAKLARAGYDRGPYYGELLADRLRHLANFSSEENLARLRALISTKKRNEADELLLQIKGIGPAVLRNFWSLQD